MLVVVYRAVEVQVKGKLKIKSVCECSSSAKTMFFMLSLNLFGCG
jgi:hypothetical protein